MPKKTPFSNLGAAEKRVAIARDVLSQIKLRRFKITPGKWAETRTPVNQEVLTKKKLKRRCVCCAAGAAALCVVRLDNKFESESGLGQQSTVDLLSRFFSASQTSQIECAFERGRSQLEFSRKAADFGYAIENPEKRAIAIFRNIIKNNGTFKP